MEPLHLGPPVYFRYRRGVCTRAVKHNVAMFSELPIAVRWHERLGRG